MLYYVKDTYYFFSEFSTYHKNINSYPRKKKMHQPTNFKKGGGEDSSKWMGNVTSTQIRK